MTKDQCINANAKAQDLRRDGRLSAARDELRSCSNPSCPAIVRDDCTRRLDELDKAQPTIAFEVKDAFGADLSVVKVSVDGRPLTERLDGSALPVDIGQHVFVFEVAGQRPGIRTLVLTEGEKGRRERVIIGAATRLAPAPPTLGVRAPAPAGRDQAPSASTSLAAEPPLPPAPLIPQSSRAPATADHTVSSGAWSRGTLHTLALVSGGLGLVGLGVGTALGLDAGSKKSQYEQHQVNGRCIDEQCVTVSKEALTSAMASTIGFVAGGVLASAGVVLWLVAPARDVEGRTVAIAPMTGVQSGIGAGVSGSW
jgi:hypothetical protein